MTPINGRILLIPLWAGLLILGGPVLLFAEGNDCTDDLFVQCLSVSSNDGLLSLIVHDVPLQTVLDEIAEHSNLRIVQHTDLERLLRLSIERQPLPAVLKKVLANDSYQLYQLKPQSAGDEDRGSESDMLWIFAEGSSMAPAATIYFEVLLFQGNVRERKEAIKGLRKLGTPDAVQSISLALGDENSSVRDLAFDALAIIGGDEALAAIASASADRDPKVRGEVAAALASSHSDSAIQYLNLAFDDPNPNVRMFVIEAFADIPSKKSVQALSHALQDESPAVRVQAVEALDQIGGEMVFLVLMGARSDEDPSVQDAVNDALFLFDYQR